MCPPLLRMSKSIAPLYVQSQAYAKNAVVMFNGMRLKAKSAIPAGKEFDINDWNRVDVQSDLGGGEGGGDMKHSEFEGLPQEDLVSSKTGIKELCAIVNQMKNLLRPSVVALLISLCALFNASAVATVEKLEDLKGSNTIVTAVNGSMTKIGNYLWLTGTEGEDFAKATNRMSKVYSNYNGRCSGVCNTRYHGRNLDWGYNKEATFVIRSPASDTKYASIGIAGGISALTDDFVMSGKWSDAYYSLPFTWSDGMNEHGVVIQQNVIQTNFAKSAAWRTNSANRIICFCIIRYALDRCASAQEAAQLICDKNFVPSEFEYDFHYLVSDRTSSFIVEDGVVYANSNTRPTDVMTNFRIGGNEIIFNEDKTVDWNTVEEYGIGLERYDSVRYFRSDDIDLNGMIQIMQGLWYTQAYDITKDPYWYTEHCDPTKPEFTVMNAKNDPSIFTDEKLAWADDYEREHDIGSGFYRAGKTWQTVHTSIYDKDNLTLCMFNQEDENSGRLFRLRQSELDVQVNGASVVSNGIANLSITSFSKFNPSWRNWYASMDELSADITADTYEKVGMCYLGDIVSMTNMPSENLGNCEVVVKICPAGVIYYEAYSTQVPPYHWDASAVNGVFNGWREVLTVASTNVVGNYMLQMSLQTNISPFRAYQWVDMQTPAPSPTPSSLKGQVFDFNRGSNFTQTVYTVLTNVIQQLGGAVTNGPAFN